MDFLQAVRDERKELASVLADPNIGIRQIVVEQLYPDEAHFIYELLQNTEDAGATEASIELHEDQLKFRHNGRSFSEDDVRAITNIGTSKKTDDDEKIGNFGIGFKSVFAYTETPLVLSPTYSFEIIGLVLPEGATYPPELNGDTQFEFPFNNPKKDPNSAYQEIQRGLDELAETTLLYLSNLETISWRCGEAESGTILKVKHSEYHVEVLKEINGKTTESSHFLIFSAPILEVKNQYVAIAFELEFLPKIETFDPQTPIANQFRIVPASTGSVAIFFTAKKESSGLRFHLHAPFVPDVSRSSIKDTPKNNTLFEQLARLVCTSLTSIRDLNLLTRDFLAVLPNESDQVQRDYRLIQADVIEAFKSEPLTPVHGGEGHAPASELLQAPATLKNLLTQEDLAFFHERNKQWVVSATQRNNNADRFLQQLNIEEWGLYEFVSESSHSLWEKFYEREEDDPPIGVPQASQKWISDKTIEWHQQFYALLSEYEEEYGASEISGLQIARLEDGSYGQMNSCYFPDDTAVQDALLPRVDARVYTSGNNAKQKQAAKNLLEAAGVKEVGERELVKLILNKRYTEEAITVGPPDEETHHADLKRFLNLYESEVRSQVYEEHFFGSFFIIEGADAWLRPADAFLDKPFINTGLGSFYAAVNAERIGWAVCENYSKIDIPIDRLQQFFRFIGVQTGLEVKEVDCKNNPEWKYLRQASGNWTRRGTNIDFTIDGLALGLNKPNLEVSRLMWRTMEHVSTRELQAHYRSNASSISRVADSQLVHTLKTKSWIPQGGDTFVRPAEANVDQLPEGFAFETGSQWLKAVEFGKEAEERSEKTSRKKELAEELGFEDEEDLDLAQQFSQLPADIKRAILAEQEERGNFELPEQNPANADRRSGIVASMAADSPTKTTEKKERSYDPLNSDVKKQARQYLKGQYTNRHDEMCCQVCQTALPFHLDNGEYYFESLQLIKELKKHHHMNYVALCPLHAAMFQHANQSEKNIKNSVLDCVGNKITVILAQKEREIYLTGTHLNDLKAIIKADETNHDLDDLADLDDLDDL